MKTILFGAFGRHNTGDMLMPHVVGKLLRKLNHELHYCDLLSRDMTQYGGHKVSSILDHLDSSTLTNVIHVGGDILGYKCKTDDNHGAINSLNGNKQEQQLIQNRLKSEFPYILNKNMFNNPGKFIMNSVGSSIPVEIDHNNFDYISTRDSHVANNNIYLAPDCVVMLRRLYKHKIYTSGTTVPYNQYISLQVSESNLTKKTTHDLCEQLKLLYKKYELPVVLYMIGTAPGHDSYHMYKHTILKNIKIPYYVCKDKNIWSICNLIANSNISISTSLHARIISYLYNIPRVTLKPAKKQTSFIKQWDKDTGVSDASGLYQIVDTLNNKQTSRNNKLITQYMKSANQWLDLLSS